jgi:YggT family protein
MTFVLFTVINFIFQFFTIVILIDVIASWIMVANVRLPDAIFRLLAIIHNIAGIVLNPIRRVIPSMGGLDLSPIIALIVLQLLQQMFVRLVRGY